MEIMVHLDPRVGATEDEGADSVRLVSHSAGVTGDDLSAVRADRGHPVPGFVGAERPTGRPGVSHRIHGDTHHLTRTVPTDTGERVVTVTCRVEDAEAVAQWRPATLLFSRRWGELAADLPDTLEAWTDLGPWPKRSRLRRFLLAESWAASVLPAVLTMLDDAVAGIRPVAIRYSDTEQAARALAALSELLTPRQAWALEFALPVVDPTRQRPAVVGLDAALHPEWDLSRSGDLDVHMIDLDAKAISGIQASPAASRHARWFIDAEGEANLDVALDGICRSREWSDSIDAEAAAATVEAIHLMPRARLEPEDAGLISRALSGLARSGSDRDAWTGIARRLHSVDRWSDTAAVSLAEAVTELARAEAGGSARLVARTLLELLRDHPGAIVQWDEAVRAEEISDMPPLDWSADETTVVAQLFEQIVAQTKDHDLPRLLHRAAPLCPPDADPLDDDRAELMARRWADDPGAFAADGWVGRDRVVAALAPILLDRFDQLDADALQQLRDGRWDWLRGALEPNPVPETDDAPDPWGLGWRRHDRLWSWLILPEHLKADDDRRLEILSDVAGSLPETAWLHFLGPVEDQLDDELVRWAEERRRIEHSLAEAIVAQLTDLDAPNHGEGRSVISALAAIEHLDVDHPELASWIDNDHRVRKLWARAREDHQAIPNLALVSLIDHYREIIHLDHDEIVAAIATLDDVTTATRMAEPVLDPISDALAVRIDEDLRQARLPALAATLRLMELSDDHWWGLGKDCLDDLWDDRTQAAVRTELATKAMHLGPEERRQLAFYQQDQADGRIGRNLRRTRGALGDLARTVFARD